MKCLTGRRGPGDDSCPMGLGLSLALSRLMEARAILLVHHPFSPCCHSILPSMELCP